MGTKPLDISYHEQEDILVIEGVRYSGDLFRTLAIPNMNDFYQIERTKELPETVTIHTLRDLRGLLQECRNEIAGWYDDSTGSDPTGLPIINKLDELLRFSDGY